jgi:hypothetical protein
MGRAGDSRLTMPGAKAAGGLRFGLQRPPDRAWKPWLAGPHSILFLLLRLFLFFILCLCYLVFLLFNYSKY